MYRKIILILVIIILAVSCAFAQGQDNKRKVAIGISYGVFFPSSSSAKDKFGDSSVSLLGGRFEDIKPMQWNPAFDVTNIKKGGANLWIISFGAQRGLSEDTKVQPYIAGRVGPYYADVKYPAGGIDEQKWGLNANAAVGVVINRNFFIEGRYDVFSTIANTNFDGFRISAGIKLFDINL